MTMHQAFYDDVQRQASERMGVSENPKLDEHPIVGECWDKRPVIVLGPPGPIHIPHLASKDDIYHSP